MSELEAAVGPDRRTFLKRMAGVAFAAPIVSSFTMTGIEAIFGSLAGATTAMANTSPTAYQQIACSVVPPGGGTINATGFSGTSMTVVVQPNTFSTPMNVCIGQCGPVSLPSFAPPTYDARSGVSVTWVGPNAATPIQLTVTDPAVAPGDEMFRVDRFAVTGPQAGTVGAGTWATTFSDDPAFLVARPPFVPPAAAPAADPVDGDPSFTG